MTFDTGTATLSGTPTQAGVYLISVWARDANDCTGFINDTLDIDAKAGPPTDREAMVPVVLRLTGSGTTYSSGLALTNTGNDGADVTLSFSGTSSGSTVQRVEARQQIAIDDVIGFLKGRGVSLAAEDVGTLRVSYTNTDPAPGVFVQATTTSPCG